MTQQTIELREMQPVDYDAVFALMQNTPGIRLRNADSAAATRRYLHRNPGLSFVAETDAGVVGCAMAGHDGRRGYLQHVIVAPPYRSRGLARRLVACCIRALEAAGIEKIHLDVMSGNAEAMTFWAHLGWHQREDLVRFSLITSGDPDA